MNTKIFNPAQFETDPSAGEQQERGDLTKEEKAYPTTGNSTRDQVRKILYEIFTQEGANPDNDSQRVI